MVVGSSLAGLRACEALRMGDYDGEIVLVGAERHRPYDRPPLSKKVLAGEWDLERIMLRRDDQFDELRITKRLGVAATGLDVEARAVRLADGSEVTYDGLIIATGSRPRLLPGQPAHARVLRGIDDSCALRAELADGGRRLAVIGAGFIGLEVASVARRQGNDVVVLEAAPAPLMRGLGAELGAAVATLHADEGVDIRCDVKVDAIDDGGIRLADGDEVPADVVLVGIGAEPVTDWLAGSGLSIDDGVVVDATLSAGRPFVYAAGDVARWPNGLFGGESMRIEHWTNAAEQGAHAARNLLAEAAGGEPADYEAVPFVWSDQYEHRIQYLGCAAAGDRVELAVGSVDERRFVALYERDGALRAVAGLNLPRLVMPYRKLLQAGASFDEALALAADQRAKLAEG